MLPRSAAPSETDDQSVIALQHRLNTLVLERLASLGLKRITLDFDGSVIGTGRYAEGTAIVLQQKKKGQRSY